MSWLGLQCVMVVFPDHTHFFHVSFFLNNQADAIEGFNSTSRSLNDSLNIMYNP